MTRKRFWGLRNALTVKLHEWAKANGLPSSGVSDRAMRPVSGKPLVKLGSHPEFGKSYDECWNSEALISFRKAIGMEE